jgi:hypothetical protein
MVAVLGREPLEYCGISPRVAMAAQFLCVKDLDGSVQLVRRAWLLDPVALSYLFISPTHEFRCNCLRNATARTTALL